MSGLPGRTWIALGLAALLSASLLLGGCGGAEDRFAEHLARAREHARQGNLEKARVDYGNTLQIDGSKAEVHYELASVLEKLQRWPRAYGHYVRARELDPEHIGARLGAGRLLVLDNQLTQAAGIAGDVLETDPDSIEALLLRASVRVRVGDSPGAIADAERVLERDPARAEAHALIAHVRLEQSRPTAAVEQLEKAVSANPDHRGVSLMFAEALSQTGRNERAIEVLEERLSLEPDSVELHVQLARTFARAGRAKAAEAQMHAALETQGSRSRNELSEALADLIVATTPVQAAPERLRQLVERYPGEHALRLRVATALERAGKLAAAELTYREVIDGEFPEALAGRARTQLAQLLAKSERFDEARQLVEETLAVNRLDRDALILHGTFAMLSNEPAQAIADYRMVLDSFPDEPSVLRLRARAHLMNNEPDQARRDLQHAVELQPDDLEARLELARLYERHRDTSEAGTEQRAALLRETTSLAQERLRADPGDAQAAAVIGHAALAMGDAERALESARTLLERDADSDDARRLLARAQLEMDDVQGARDTAEALVDADPTDVRARVELARALVHGGDDALAETHLLAARRAAPDDLEVLDQLARLRIARQNWPGALEAAQSLTFAHPRLSAGFYLTGIAHQGLGDLAASEKAYRLALERSANAVAPLTALAHVYLERGKLVQADAVLTDALAHDPDDVRALNLVGEIALARNQADEAKVAFRKAMSLDPRWSVSHRNLALARLADGDTDGAIDAYQSALADEGPSLAAAYELASLFERTGKVDLAIGQYEAVLKADPAAEIAANNLAMLLVTHRGDQRSLERARALIAPHTDTGRAAFLDTAGWVHHKLGEHERARQLLLEAVDASPGEAEFHYHLGMIYLELDALDLAAEHLGRSLREEQPFNGRPDAEAAFARVSPTQSPDS